jgi:hypothetical protein
MTDVLKEMEDGLATLDVVIGTEWYAGAHAKLHSLVTTDTIRTLLSHIRAAEERAGIAAEHPIGTRYHIEHDGFSGTVIGHYVTREGKPGVVLQLDNARVVHVYGTKWLAAAIRQIGKDAGHE